MPCRGCVHSVHGRPQASFGHSPVGESCEACPCEDNDDAPDRPHPGAACAVGASPLPPPARPHRAVCAVLSVTSYLSARDSARDAAADRVLSIAETLAHDPFVAEAVAGPDPSAALQPFAQTVIDTAEVDFVTIMDSDRTRYTHPDPTEIGKPYIGSIGTALTGQSEVEEYVGTSVLGAGDRADHGRIR